MSQGLVLAGGAAASAWMDMGTVMRAGVGAGVGTAPARSCGTITRRVAVESTGPRCIRRSTRSSSRHTVPKLAGLLAGSLSVQLATRSHSIFGAPAADRGVRSRGSCRIW